MEGKLGERLVEAGLITEEAVKKALSHQKITGHRLGECLVEIGLITEGSLLRFLAGELKTRFVSAEKLSQAKIAPEVLEKVPVRMAEAQQILPLALDPDRRVLSIVASEPQNKPLLDEIALVAGVDQVYAYVGLASAIRAGIKKHYYGDPTSFTNPEVSAAKADLSALAEALEAGASKGPAAPIRLESETKLGTRAALRLGREVGGGALLTDDYVETLNILIGRLESGRGPLRGHSARLARVCKAASQVLGLGPKEANQIAIAALLHNLGKPETHYNLIGNAQKPEWKQEAKRHLRAPLKLFDAVNLPIQIGAILSHLYEAFDGSGVPSGVAGNDIPLGARILSATDCYLDLIKLGKDPQGRPITRDQALAQVQRHSGELFDPLVVDVISRIHQGELIQKNLLAEGRLVLVADPDEATRTDLSDALTKTGLVTQVLASYEGAFDAAIAQEIDLLAIGARFGIGAIASLIEQVRSRPKIASLPIVVLGEPKDPQGRERLAQAGATQMIAMPFDPDQVATRLSQILQDAIAHGWPARPVHGAIDELGHQALLSTLSRARKSGRIAYRLKDGEATLHLEDGKAVFATFKAEKGEQALSSIQALEEGDFVYDADALLLELPSPLPPL